MQKAKINIEITEEITEENNYDMHIVASGSCYLLMRGLTTAIKRLEKGLPEEFRYIFRSEILEMLNDRD